MTIEEIVKRKAELIAQKQFEMKKADPVLYSVGVINEGSESVTKATASDAQRLIDANKMAAQLVINTTNIMDSHDDVHIPGLWKKSLQERKSLYLLKEHKMTFENIISDEVKAKTMNVSWSELGFNYEGTTQALIFDATLTKDRNPYMFEQYAKGYVKEHSVGMRYVKIDLAVNDDRYEDEYKVWKKYIDQIINREQAESKGYFWAVTEAKLVEGSAVVMGSNYATPTMRLEPKELEAVEDTSKNEPGNSTQNKQEDSDKGSLSSSIINYSF